MSTRGCPLIRHVCIPISHDLHIFHLIISAPRISNTNFIYYFLYLKNVITRRFHSNFILKFVSRILPQKRRFDTNCLCSQLFLLGRLELIINTTPSNPSSQFTNPSQRVYIYITTFVFQIAFPLFRARNFSEKRREGSGWQRFARHGRKAKIRRLIG